MSSNFESKTRAKREFSLTGTTRSKSNRKEDEEQKKLDDAFKGLLDDMKPFVLSLSKKNDRQRIALWIKKLCEPVGEKVVDRKNRNLYAQILLHMLRKGKLEDPFDDKPDPGPLPIMPAYMGHSCHKSYVYSCGLWLFDKNSIYLDEPLKLGKTSSKVKNRNAPSWIRNELPSSDSAFSDVFSKSLEADVMDETQKSPSKHRRSPKRKERETFQRRSVDSDSSDMDDTRKISPRQRGKAVSPEDDTLTGSEEDATLHLSKERRKRPTPPPSPVRRRLEDDFGNPGNRYKPTKKWSPSTPIEKSEVKKGYSASSFYSNGYSSFVEEKENQRQQDRELELKVKMLEAKFAEEKLSMQQQHDATVQKILDRKNVEIEEIKDHYRSKVGELESAVKRMEKKNSRTARDSSQAKERHEKEMSELKAIIEQNSKNSEVDFERRLHDKVAEFEQEKFDMQKQHTNNIQELLDETNARLRKMEEEHSKEANEAASVNHSLNNKLQQLGRDLEALQKQHRKVLQEKEELINKLEELTQYSNDQKIIVARLEKENSQILEEHDNALRELKRKTDSTIDSMKKEHSNATSKVSAVISDLESQVNQYKQALQESELQRKRELRIVSKPNISSDVIQTILRQEMESNHKQEILGLEVSHEKKVRNLQNDIEEQQIDFQLRTRKVDTTLREKDEKIQQLNEQLKDQNRDAERAIDDFKRQAEENSRKMFRELKEQLENMESELTKSLHTKEIQEKQFKRELEEERTKRNKQIMELKIAFEEEKNKLLKQHETDTQIIKKEHEKEKEALTVNLRETVKQKEETSKSKQDKDSKTDKSWDVFKDSTSQEYTYINPREREKNRKFNIQ